MQQSETVRRKFQQELSFYSTLFPYVFMGWLQRAVINFSILKNFSPQTDMYIRINECNK